jgi:hypothetical protein
MHWWVRGGQREGVGEVGRGRGSVWIEETVLAVTHSSKIDLEPQKERHNWLD